MPLAGQRFTFCRSARESVMSESVDPRCHFGTFMCRRCTLERRDGRHRAAETGEPSRLRARADDRDEHPRSEACDPERDPDVVRQLGSHGVFLK